MMRRESGSDLVSDPLRPRAGAYHGGVLLHAAIPTPHVHRGRGIGVSIPESHMPAAKNPSLPPRPKVP